MSKVSKVDPSVLSVPIPGFLDRYSITIDGKVISNHGVKKYLTPYKNKGTGAREVIGLYYPNTNVRVKYFIEDLLFACWGIPPAIVEPGSSTKKLTVRITPDEYDLFKSKADELGITINQYLVNVIRHAHAKRKSRKSLQTLL